VRRPGQAGAKAGSVLTLRRMADPPAAHREDFMEMLWRIIRKVANYVARTVGVQR
jgi:hypothetical protein